MKLITLLLTTLLLSTSILSANSGNKSLAYIVSDITIPFWKIMSKGIEKEAQRRGYNVRVYSANNIKKSELENTIKAIRSNVSGIIISPISSSTAVTILKLAKNNNIPVVISDIGTDGGEFVSYISSDNKKGAYDIGKVLVKKMEQLKIKNGKVGIIAIPQKRLNGKLRTAGFLKAMEEAGIKGGNIKQQIDFSYEETYNYTVELIKENRDLNAIWLQGSDKYLGASNAIKDMGKEGKILLICFDAEPIFLELIPRGILVGAAMQQPYLMGEKAIESLDMYLNNQKVQHIQQLEILAISQENIQEKLPLIKRNVLGIE